MKVIIAEKPSVAKNISDALTKTKRQDGYIETDGYYITWAFGHLLTLFDSRDYNSEMDKWKMNNFPFIPEEFKYKIKSNPKNRNKPDPGAKAQLEVIKSLIKRKEVTHVISATDYDREGQVIGDIILDFLKVTKPVERLLLNEWTPDAVRNGLNSLIPNNEMKSVSDAGLCRQWADWTIGINLTSIASLKFIKGSSGPINIGRVLLPALKVIYDRDKEISEFKPESFYKMTGLFHSVMGEEYEGLYQCAGKDRFFKKDELKDIQNLMKGTTASINKREVISKKEYAPLLFNLSELQGYVTSCYSGWTSSKVLNTAQSLYEKKFITYPRTGSSVLDETLAERTEKVLNTLKKGTPHEKELRFFVNPRVFNSKKVEGHSAIIPTYIHPQSLSKDESIVYEAILTRFFMQFLPVHEYDETIVSTKMSGVAGEFITKGKTVSVEGWKKLLKNDTRENTLPGLRVGEKVGVQKTSISSHKTISPKFHTEKSLLKVMENCGRAYNTSRNDSEIMNEVLNGFSIGTPATRAETILKLGTAGYVCAKGKNLMTTDLGKALVEKFPVKELFNLDYTGRLEKTLYDIEKGTVNKDEFLTFIFNFTRQSVRTIKNYEGGKNLNNTNESGTLGNCPLCGSEVTESERNFGCSGWKEGCKYSIWKNDRFLSTIGVTPTKEMIITLLKDKKVFKTGLISKKGTTYDAYLSIEKNPESGYMSWKMDFPDKKS